MHYSESLQFQIVKNKRNDFVSGIFGTDALGGTESLNMSHALQRFEVFRTSRLWFTGADLLAVLLAAALPWSTSIFLVLVVPLLAIIVSAWMWTPFGDLLSDQRQWLLSFFSSSHCLEYHGRRLALVAGSTPLANSPNS
jgi:hypothetical protein